MTVAIVTDSTADLPAAVAAAYEIAVVPLFVNFGATRYRDSVDLSHDRFYALMTSEPELPTTSQPTAAMFEDVFRPLVAAGRPIVVLTISSKLSGTINAAQAAATQFPGAEIRIIDSTTVAGGLALLAVHAATLAREGAGVATIAASIARDIERQRGFAALPDLAHIARTGRLSRAQALIGGLVKIVPVLTFTAGEVRERARVRTFARAQETMLGFAAEALGDGAGAYLGIIHADAPELAASLLARLRAGLRGTPAFVLTLESGPVIATHAGIGACGIFVIPA